MEIMTYKNFEGTAEVDVNQGICHGKLLFINDLVTYQAESPKELRREFELAVDDYLETCKKLGREAQRPFRGMFNVRISPERHREAALRAVKDGVSLNELMGCALNAYLHSTTAVTHNHLNLTLNRPENIGSFAAFASLQAANTPIRYKKGVTSAH